MALIEVEARHRGAWRQALLVAGLLCVGGLPAALGGCESVERFYDSKLPIGDAVDWWHRQQGGVIASERPPPPGVGEPYPNLASVPARPTPTDAQARRALAARLGNERDRAITQAAREPLPDLKPGPAPRRAAAVALGPAAGTEAAPGPSATIEAATAVPARAAAVPAVPDAPPAPPAFAAAAAATPPSRGADAASRFVAGPVPPLPGVPPAPPVLPGIPAATFAPPVAKPDPQIMAAFLPGSAVLRPESDEALRGLATRRGRGSVALLGGGDAVSADPAVQAAALPLAWRRARAMADVLVAAGVPVAAMRIDAAALGRGGVARLLY